MSDIYLQITETPTVVTLSAPVISGALSSTVTVANVVSVNVVTMPSITVQAASVTTVIGTVTVGNSVNINSLPAIRINPNYDGQSGNNGPVVESDNSIGYDPRYMVFAGGIDVSNNEYRGLTFVSGGLAVAGTVTVGSALPTGTNRIGVVTIGGGTVTIGAGTAQIGSVTASISGTVPVSGTFFQTTQPVSLTSTTVTVSSLPPISGTVTANINSQFYGESTNKYAIRSCAAFIDGGDLYDVTTLDPLPVSIYDSNGQSYGSSASPLKVSGTVTIGAGTAQIGSVTASISGTVPISISSVTVGNSVTIGSCVTHGVTISNTVVTFFPAQGTTVANSNFTSITASTSLVSADSGREVLTVFNEGAGNLHISPGATCTTVAYQVRLSAGDYWECPAGQLTLAHTAVFATAGTARVTQVS